MSTRSHNLRLFNHIRSKWTGTPITSITGMNLGSEEQDHFWDWREEEIRMLATEERLIGDPNFADYLEGWLGRVFK